MITVLWHTLRESYNRRMGLVLLIISVLVAGLYLWFPRIVTQPDGSIVAYMGERLQGKASAYADSMFMNLLRLSGTLWVMVGAFAAAPLLTSHMEKGWVDLLLSKGVARWQMFLARWLGALVLFIASMALMTGIPTLYFWVRAGVTPGRFFPAVSMIVLSFAALLALMALISMAHASQAVPITFAILYTAMAPMLAFREHVLYDIIKAKWAHWLIDWIYRILPKTHELGQMASVYLQTGAIKEWWPVWSSGLFILGALALSCWLMHRKSF